MPALHVVFVILMVLLDGARFHGPGLLEGLGLGLARKDIPLDGFAMVHSQLLGLWRVDRLACLPGRWWRWAWRNHSRGLGFRHQVRWWRSLGWLWPQQGLDAWLACAWRACA